MPFDVQGPTYADVEKAASRIEGIAHRTPVLTSRNLNADLAADVYFKCENFQRTGAFKFRGAFNAIASLAPERRSRGVVSFSSGNHAQAIALAGGLLDTPATLVMPRDAPKIKADATRRYGGNIFLYDRYTENREQISERLAAEGGLTLIPSYDHPDLIAGQGTASKELFEEIGNIDRLFVPLGGGGLLAGAALAAEKLSPSCKIIGVEPETANDGQQSFRSGAIVRIPVPKSIADGAVVTHLGEFNFPIIRRLVYDVVTVSDASLVSAMRYLAERMKLIVEPTGCLAAAAVLSRAFHQAKERIGVIISGGNVDMDRFAELLRG